MGGVAAVRFRGFGLSKSIGCETHMRIFVDCTQTLACGVKQGIPRVVRSLVRHGRQAARRQNADLVPVRFEAGCFRIVPTLPDDELAPCSPLFASNSWSCRASGRVGKAILPRAVRRALNAAAARLTPNKLPATQFRRGDVLLLADSSWRIPLWSAVDEARMAGVLLGVVQHDFIPLTHPHVVPERSVAVFRRWAHASLTRADFVLAVSRTVADEAREYLQSLGRAFIAERCVDSFCNGADFVAETDRRVVVRPELRDLFSRSGSPLFLTVGTIEPRKNQALLLGAIDRLHAVAPDAILVLAGSPGWGGEPILRRFRDHPEWNRTIFHIADLDDGELRETYCQATALVFPSLAEGYGLPIVEALACGTRVIASDLGVHREHAADGCLFFNPSDPRQLADAMIAAARGEGRAVMATRFVAPTWGQAARHIVATAMRHAAATASETFEEADETLDEAVFAERRPNSSRNASAA